MVNSRWLSVSVLGAAMASAGASAGPPVDDDLTVWLTPEAGVDASCNGMPLLEWAGAGVHLSHDGGFPRYASGPFGGGVRFLGDASLATAAGEALLDGVTVFVTVRDESIGASSEPSFILSIGSLTGGGGVSLGYGPGEPGARGLYHDSFLDGPSESLGGVVPHDPGGSFEVIAAVFGGAASGGGASARINGVDAALTPVGGGGDTVYGVDLSTLRLGSGPTGERRLAGGVREVLIYGRELAEAEIEAVEAYLLGRTAGLPAPAPADAVKVHGTLSGQPNPSVYGLTPFGDVGATGQAVLEIDPSSSTMTYVIELSGLASPEHKVTQAHLYHLGIKPNGDSVACWGGRWSTGACSTAFLVGTGYSNGWLSSVAQDPSGWFLMVHTEGGYFAVGEDGRLIEYNAWDPEQEVSVTGQPETGSRFNNRVGRVLTDRLLKVENTKSTAQPPYEFDPANLASAPFPDALGRAWTEPDPDHPGAFRLTEEAVAEGYDETTPYLFYLFDDQGPSWDYGGPEGALGGLLSIADAAPPACPGDVTGNGVVDSTDLNVVLASFGAAGGPGDADADGVVGSSDLNLVLASFEQVCPE